MKCDNDDNNNNGASRIISFRLERMHSAQRKQS